MKLAFALAAAAAFSSAADGPVIRAGFHLTARPWTPLQTPRERYLDVVEGVCRFTARQQDASGAIIDPFLHREHQYATPYFAHAVGALVSAGRAPDLLPHGIRAMDHATESFAGGRNAIPDQHGEFFIAALTEALELYERVVPEDRMAIWRERMRRPLADVLGGGQNNWETYPMKGEWLRALAGLADRRGAVAFIEGAWSARQRGRFAPPPWSVYHDRSSDPDTLSVEAVGRGNLLALVAAGYDGPSAGQMRQAVEAGTRLALDMQDPSGQAPANGRTKDHVWVDVGYQLGFEVMARRAVAADDAELAGQYRRAALMAFDNIQRWRRSDGAWAGSFYVTKNRFDPALRVGYQTASQYSNYNGSLMFHLAEAYLARSGEIEERPAPAEIGGYAVAMEPEFATAFANAGGMQLQANLRGQTAESSGNWWTPLGIVRFARAGWDTRLGPSDGALTAAGGISFAPEFREDGKWLRMADLSQRYEGVWTVTFTHPLLVRCSIVYRPRAGQSGPTFRDDLILTPDGVLSTMRKTSQDDVAWGVTWPILENDGRPLVRSAAQGVRSTRFRDGGDEENFLTPDEAAIEDGPALRSTYGDLRAVRVRPRGGALHTFVYPRSPDDPPAEEVRRSLVITADGFRSLLGRVEGSLYVGRTAAGGVGEEAAGVTFPATCGFLAQLRGGKVLALEADRPITAKAGGRSIRLEAFRPRHL